MKIYTGTGDSGTTGTYGGGRVDKASVLMNAIGEIDELNSYIGLLFSQLGEYLTDRIQPSGHEIQDVLFRAGAYLASHVATKGLQVVTEVDIEQLEKQIDYLTDYLEPQKSFILPGGTQEAATAFVARAVCRRAERALWDSSLLLQWNPSEVGWREFRPHLDPLRKYINRLSDYLFVVGRYWNQMHGVQEIAWKPKKTE